MCRDLAATGDDDVISRLLQQLASAAAAACRGVPSLCRRCILLPPSAADAGESDAVAERSNHAANVYSILLGNALSQAGPGRGYADDVALAATRLIAALCCDKQCVELLEQRLCGLREPAKFTLGEARRGALCGLFETLLPGAGGAFLSRKITRPVLLAAESALELLSAILEACVCAALTRRPARGPIPAPCIQCPFVRTSTTGTTMTILRTIHLRLMRSPLSSACRRRRARCSAAALFAACSSTCCGASRSSRAQ